MDPSTRPIARADFCSGRLAHRPLEMETRVQGDFRVPFALIGRVWAGSLANQSNFDPPAWPFSCPVARIPAEIRLPGPGVFISRRARFVAAASLHAQSAAHGVQRLQGESWTSPTGYLAEGKRSGPGRRSPAGGTRSPSGYLRHPSTEGWEKQGDQNGHGEPRAARVTAQSIRTWGRGCKTKRRMARPVSRHDASRGRKKQWSRRPVGGVGQLGDDRATGVGSRAGSEAHNVESHAFDQDALQHALAAGGWSNADSVRYPPRNGPLLHGPVVAADRPSSTFSHAPPSRWSWSPLAHTMAPAVHCTRRRIPRLAGLVASRSPHPTRIRGNG
jgi:hypothetical protein